MKTPKIIIKPVEKLPYPLFEVDDSELELLKKVSLHYPTSFLSFLCNYFEFNYRVKQSNSLVAKIRNSLNGHNTLEAFLSEELKYDVSVLYFRYELRSAWISALIKHNEKGQ